MRPVFAVPPHACGAQFGVAWDRLDVHIPAAVVSIVLGLTVPLRWRVGPAPLERGEVESKLHVAAILMVFLPSIMWLELVRPRRACLCLLPAVLQRVERAASSNACSRSCSHEDQHLREFRFGIHATALLAH